MLFIRHTVTVTTSSHRRHRQDNTVLSCLILSAVWTELATVAVFSSPQYIGDWSSEQFCPVSSAVWTHLWTSLDPVPTYDVTTGNHVACELENGSEQDKTQFTPHFETGQNCFEIFSRRQFWLIANSVHTADADKTRQDSPVLSVSAVWTRTVWTQRQLLDGVVVGRVSVVDGDTTQFVYIKRRIATDQQLHFFSAQHLPTVLTNRLALPAARTSDSDVTNN